jgi:steroid delta-isomerase-like uncharacterized protein
MAMNAAATPDDLAARVSLVKEHLRAENDHDLDAIMATFGQNARFELNGTVLSDRTSIRGLYADFGFGEGGSFSDVRAELREMYVSEETIVTELVLTGRHTATWQGIEPTDRGFSFPACAIFCFDGDGKLAGERVYFDGASLQQQLGVLA